MATLSIHKVWSQALARTFHGAVFVILPPPHEWRGGCWNTSVTLQHKKVALNRTLCVVQTGVGRILVVKGEPQSEEPGALLFGLTGLLLLCTVLKKHANQSKSCHFSHVHTKLPDRESVTLLHGWNTRVVSSKNLLKIDTNNWPIFN